MALYTLEYREKWSSTISFTAKYVSPRVSGILRRFPN